MKRDIAVMIRPIIIKCQMHHEPVDRNKDTRLMYSFSKINKLVNYLPYTHARTFFVIQLEHFPVFDFVKICIHFQL